MPTPTTDRINSIIEQWVMLITDMNLNITAMEAAMPERGQVRRRMQSAVAKMVGTKEEMETSLGSLLELASDMAEPGQNRCHELPCLQPHVMHCLSLVVQVLSRRCRKQPSQWCKVFCCLS